MKPFPRALISWDIAKSELRIENILKMDNASAEMAEDFIDMIFVEKWAKLIKTLIDASDILLPNKEELHITDLMDDMLKPEV